VFLLEQVVSCYRHGLPAANKVEAGGLSGPPLKPYALATWRALRAQLPASIPIIGCGGISTGADALEYAKAGAAAVQIYTSFGYDGVGACRRIKDELTEALQREGATWADVVRRATSELSLKDVDTTQPSKESTIGQLTEEANELMRLLDQLGERMTADSEPLPVEAAVLPVVAEP